jgi:hypothetical protein
VLNPLDFPAAAPASGITQPRRFSPPPARPGARRPFRWGAVLKISPEGKPLQILMDPDGSKLADISAVTEHDGGSNPPYPPPGPQLPHTPPSRNPAALGRKTHWAFIYCFRAALSLVHCCLAACCLLFLGLYPLGRYRAWLLGVLLLTSCCWYCRQAILRERQGELRLVL